MRRLPRLAAVAAAGLLAACAADPFPPLAPPPPGPPPFPLSDATAAPSWRDAALPADAQRLERLDAAWEAGLSAARRADAARLSSLASLVDPAAGLAGAGPPVGGYRCRTVKLGGERGLPLVVYDWFACRIERLPGGGLRLVKLTGSQRQAGRLFPDGDRRMVFLGAVAWGAQETSAPAYGADENRDQVGYLERTGERRWRLALPWPRQESVLDLIELVPG